MGVRREFCNGKCVRLLAASFAERVPAADVNRCAPAQIRQREVHPPVSAEGRAEQREERLVLVDRKELTVAQGPALRSKDEAHDSDFRQKWFSHRFLLL